MIDIIIRDCGHGEWLPIIVVSNTGKELFRGNRHREREKAWGYATTAWDGGASWDIRDFKKEHRL